MFIKKMYGLKGRTLFQYREAATGDALHGEAFLEISQNSQESTLNININTFKKMLYFILISFISDISIPYSPINLFFDMFCLLKRN